MRTFHPDAGPLHGRTVVVETRGDVVYVGRCHAFDGERLVLLGAAEHRDGDDPGARAAFLRRAARIGVWPQHRALTIPRAAVVSVRPLASWRCGP